MKILELYFKNINKIFKIISIVFASSIVLIGFLFLWHMYYFEEEFLQFISYKNLSSLLSIFLNYIYRIILINWLIVLISAVLSKGFIRGRTKIKEKDKE